MYNILYQAMLSDLLRHLPLKYSKVIAMHGTLKPGYNKQFLQTLFVHYIKCNMLSKSSKWELSLIRYIAKFTTTRFVISRFECAT